MKGDWPDDTFTENDILRCLEARNLKFRNGSRYILTQCPTHDDANPSAQIYKDDWFVNCHSTCGRYHITKAFPELRDESRSSGLPQRTRENSKDKVMEHEYKPVDLIEFWEKLEEIPEDHVFKGIPIDVLHDLGWRYDSNNNRYFIPYFSASRQSIPFAQWRNLGEGPRFNFWKDAKPTCYGTWNLDNPKLFVVEGTSDAAVLEYCGVPWIALPSANASKDLVKAMAGYCKENNIELVYAGDNDAAGNKLRETLDEVTSYRVKQPPTKYKDWGDFFEAEGLEPVQNYCFEELFGKTDLLSKVEVTHASTLENVQKVFPGAEELEIIDDGPEKGKEPDLEPSMLF